MEHFRKWPDIFQEGCQIDREWQRISIVLYNFFLGLIGDKDDNGPIFSYLLLKTFGADAVLGGAVYKYLARRWLRGQDRRYWISDNGHVTKKRSLSLVGQAVEMVILHGLAASHLLSWCLSPFFLSWGKRRSKKTWRRRSKNCSGIGINYLPGCFDGTVRQDDGWG